MNKVILIGRICKDIELRYTQSNNAVAQFVLAVNTGRKDQQGKDIADFINIIVWNKQAENCSQYVGKGSQIAVLGRITTRSYEKDGQRRYVTEVVAENVQFLDSKNNGNANETQSNTEETQNEVQDPFAEMGDIVQNDVDLPF